MTTEKETFKSIDSEEMLERAKNDQNLWVVIKSIVKEYFGE